MFDLSWEKLAALLVIAMLIFGPDRLPGLARDLARLLRQLRDMARGAREQLGAELGPEFSHLDPDLLHPKAFVRKHLLEDLDDLRDLRDLRDLGRIPDPGFPRGGPEAGDGLWGQQSRSIGEPAPFDPDAT